MNFLVIGGTGYMGKILVRLLLDRGDTVTVFSRGTSKPEWWNEVHHIQGDCSGILRVVAQGCGMHDSQLWPGANLFVGEGVKPTEECFPFAPGSRWLGGLQDQSEL